eukprot:3273749-Lingulodinium_polyedra.AAC.1
MTACRVGTALAQATIYIMGCCAAAGCWFALEHPQDRGPPVPSLFVTDAAVALAKHFDAVTCRFDQCCFGCAYRKPTQILLRAASRPASLSARCWHAGGHAVALGRAAGGRGFVTTALARYPARLCAALAELCWAARGEPRDGRGGLDAWLGAWPGPGLPAL